MKDNDIMKDNVRQAKRLPIAALFHAVGDMLQEVVDDISKRNSRGKATQGGPANADIVSSSSSSDEEDEEEEEPAYNDDGKVYKFDSVKLEGGVMHVRTRFSDLTMAWLPLSKIDSQYDARMRDFLKNFRGSANVAPGNRVTAKMARDAWTERMQQEETLAAQEVDVTGTNDPPPMQWEVVVKKEEGATPSSKRARKSPPVGRRVKLTKITPSPADRGFAIKKTPVPSQAKTAAGQASGEKPAPSAGEKPAPASEGNKPAPASEEEKPAAGQASGGKPVPGDAEVASGLETLQRMLTHMATMGFTHAQIAETMAAHQKK
eukprot:jgi/Mesvir1/26653/Mv20442-RA.1